MTKEKTYTLNAPVAIVAAYCLWEWHMVPESVWAHWPQVTDFAVKAQGSTDFVNGGDEILDVTNLVRSVYNQARVTKAALTLLAKRLQNAAVLAGLDPDDVSLDKVKAGELGSPHLPLPTLGDDSRALAIATAPLADDSAKTKGGSRKNPKNKA